MPPLRSRREQWLLALMVLRQDRDTPREWLATTLWPDSEASQALLNLRRGLTNLRQALGAPRLLSPAPRTVRLDLTDAFVDVLVFDSLLARTTSAAAPTSAVQEAVELYRGPLLPDCLEEWAAVERNQREQTYLAALEMLAAHAREAGDPTASIHWLRLLVSADPYRESAYIALMQALADCGDQAAITSIYQNLRLLLHRDLNTAPAPQTEALYQQLSRQERPPTVIASPPPDVPATRRHLPVPLSDLIGREEERDEILGWMQRRRLVTLVGTGGIGKTRLAIAVAEKALSQFEQGVWFVDLAPLSDPALVPQAAAKALGIAEERSRPLAETLKEALASRRLLLVLDNCEHLLEACADFVYLLLSACPALSIVATSRQALNITGEQVCPVPSLPLPPPETPGQIGDSTALEKDAHVLMEYDAIRLFVDRAIHVQSLFRLNRRNAPAVVEICRRLDGIPLAIEMAAARLRSLSLGEILARLADRFPLLTSGSRGVLPRQQTLRAAIDWSYDLLSEAERILLRRLSVFAGGWGGDAVACIGGEERPTSTPTFAPNSQDLLASLVEKSLVLRREGENDAVRYGMLETIRQYAWECLEASGERSEIQRRHGDFYLRLAEEAEASGAHAGERDLVPRLEEEHDNLRAALAWSLIGMEAGGVRKEGAPETLSPPSPALRFCGALLPFWRTRGYLSEGREWCARTLETGEGQARIPERAKALNAAGTLANLMGDYGAAHAYHAESLDISQELGDRNGLSIALNGLGNAASNRGDYAAARTYYEETLTLRRALGDGSGIGAALNNLGNVARNQGDYVSAQTYYEESLILLREAGNRPFLANVLNNLGRVVAHQGDYARAQSYYTESLLLARETGDRGSIANALICLGNVVISQNDASIAQIYYQESLEMFREIGHRSGIGATLNGLGDAACSQGDNAAARVYYEESLTIFREIGHRPFLANTLHGLGGVASKQGDDVMGRACYEESLRLQEEIGDRYGIAHSLGAFATLAVKTDRLEQAAQLWGAAAALLEEIGSPLSAGERERHDREVAEVRRTLEEEVFSAAWESGRTMTLKQAVRSALSEAGV